ncbi:MAG: hypothetical protein IJX27_05995 [Clostridia bacterium]|nr:hypothetical protein [Clostridia bacterium]
MAISNEKDMELYVLTKECPSKYIEYAEKNISKFIGEFAGNNIENDFWIRAVR